ncbi:MAG: BirA family transcriptional regulator [Cryptosporangiaceae bacterium]|nr:BirA family transcriptional regulator [Cryptosporangiaceae bacterium]
MYSDLGRPPLSAMSLRRALIRPGGLWTNLDLRPTTVSTNADAVAAAKSGAPEGLVVVAEEQTGGRGRLDRGWDSSPRAGLTFSLLLRPDGVPMHQWGWLPLLAGVALTRAIRRIGEVEAVLKWPNDLLIGPFRRKAAGLLAEVSGQAVIVGIGLNVTTRAEELPHTGATSLAVEKAACVDRDTLLRAILREVAGDYELWRDSGGDPDGSGLRAVYAESCGTLGQHVTVELPSGSVLVGEAVDVDGGGRLVVDPDGGGPPVAVAAGDVIHARLN